MNKRICRPTKASVALSLLPVDLLSLPIVLILLAVMPVGYALATLCVALLPVLGRLHREGALEVRVPGFIRLGLMTLSFGISRELYTSCDGCHLSSQLLWLAWFVVGHLLYYVYKRRWGMASFVQEGECCCSRRRRQVLATQYMRFDRRLLWVTLGVLIISIPLQQLAEVNPLIDRLASIGIALVAFGTIVYELIHLNWVKRQLDDEYWITVMGEHDEVIGRIAATELRQAGGRLPEVRVMAYSNGMIYLERGDGLLDPSECYDTPFRTWIHEGRTPQDMAQYLIDSRFCGLRRAVPRRLLRYHHSEDGVPVLVYFFAVEVETPDLLQIDCRPCEGKWWPLEQVMPLLEQRDFSPYLRAELPLMEQTVLLAQRLRERQTAPPSPIPQ